MTAHGKHQPRRNRDPARVQSGIAAERVDAVAAELQTAQSGQYEWVSSPFFLDLALRRPVEA